MTSKTLISIRLNPNILDWFKTTAPKGYQKLIHSILTNYVNEQQLRSAHKCGRAQEIFRQFYTQCFWHYDRNLRVTSENLQLVIDNLEKYGGRQGYQLAAELRCH